MTNDVISKRSKKSATILTLLCIAANIPLIAFILFGPKEGMEELGILFPWLLTGAVHITLVFPAIWAALGSRQHRANIWIYLYFILFFGFHIIFLAHTSGLDTRINQKFTAFWHPDQAKLHQLLSELRYNPSDEKTDRVELLILNGVDVNAMFPGDKQSALQKAAYMGSPRLVRLLLQKGAYVDGPPNASVTPLGWAVQQNHTEAASLMLDSGADPNKGVSGYSFLRTAIQHQNLDLVTALLKAGADPNRRIYRVERPLMIAAMNGYTPILETLLKAGADVNFQLPNGETALVVAVINGHSDCVNALLNAGAKLDGNAFRGTGLLALAAVSENSEIFARIQKVVQLKSGPDNNGHSSYRNRYMDLFKALNENRLDDFKKMLQIGISPDSTNDQERTLLEVFCSGSLRRYYKHLDIINAAKILIENGADINRSSKDGSTLLMSASSTGQLELVKLLIHNGAEINAENKSGHNALYYAMAGKNKEVADVLLSSGAKK